MARYHTDLRVGSKADCKEFKRTVTLFIELQRCNFSHPRATVTNVTCQYLHVSYLIHYGTKLLSTKEVAKN